jgi:hypothetical protein
MTLVRRLTSASDRLHALVDELDRCGYTAAAKCLAVRRVTMTPLDDPILWGGPVDDERYLIVSPGLA